MPFDINGWIEVDRIGQCGESSWQGLLSLAPVIDVPDEVSERLFGLSKRCAAEELMTNAFAAGRGVPNDHSDEVRSDLKKINELEQKHGQGECGGYTYATWKEIKDSDIDPATIAPESDWVLVFDLMKRLEKDSRFAEDRIRIVLWYIW